MSNLTQNRFYEYDQNNSGGKYKAPAITVIIEAQSPAQANAIARDYGLYFDGCDVGVDCPCCGDRWQEHGPSESGDSVPSYSGIPLTELKDQPGLRYCSARAKRYQIPFALIIYLNGETETWNLNHDQS